MGMPETSGDAGSLRAEMRRLVRRAAEPPVAGESIKAQIARAARRLGFSYGRAKRYWYLELQHPYAVDVERARSVLSNHRRIQAIGRSGPHSEIKRGAFVYDGDGLA